MLGSHRHMQGVGFANYEKKFPPPASPPVGNAVDPPPIEEDLLTLLTPLMIWVMGSNCSMDSHLMMPLFTLFKQYLFLGSLKLVDIYVGHF